MASEGRIRIGTSGWSYPRGRGTWNGVFYPAHRPGGFRELPYYAEHFDTVEINSTFYGEPRPGVARNWVEQTPRGFEFSLKLHQRFTHPRMHAARVAASTALREPVPAGVLRPTAGDIDRFRRSIDPIPAAGKLGALLIQFPPSFKDTPASREHLDWLLQAFGDYSPAVELRHRSWSDRSGDTLALLDAAGAALVQIDEPKFRLSIRQNLLPNTEGSYYLRLHGRNAAAWWQHDAVEDRYDYLYSPDELEPYAETAVAVRALVKNLRVYFNNHFAAKSVANAVMLKQRLGQPVEGTYPPEFVEAYPDLGAAVRVTPTLGHRPLIAHSPQRG